MKAESRQLRAGGQGIGTGKRGVCNVVAQRDNAGGREQPPPVSGSMVAKIAPAAMPSRSPGMLPVTPQSRFVDSFHVVQLARKELNLRPASYKDAALTAELRANSRIAARDQLGRRDSNPLPPD